MSYKIEFSSRAARDFKKLAKTNRAMAIKIKDAIAELAEEPRPRGVETLTGTNPSLQRIRVGDFRVIYEIKVSVSRRLEFNIGKTVHLQFKSGKELRGLLSSYDDESGNGTLKSGTPEETAYFHYKEIALVETTT